MGSFLISSVYAEEDHHDEHGDEKESEHAGHEEGHEETSTKFGPGKAIIAVRNEGQSFQLSEESSRFTRARFLSTYGNKKSSRK